MDIWKEGKYLDLWSVNHFLSGIVFTGWLSLTGANIWFLGVLYLVVAVGWEIFETFKGIQEHIGNKVMDVITGILGFFTVLVFGTELWWLVVITLIYVLMELHGYFAYTKRSSNLIH